MALPGLRVHKALLASLAPRARRVTRGNPDPQGRREKLGASGLPDLLVVRGQQARRATRVTLDLRGLKGQLAILDLLALLAARDPQDHGGRRVIPDLLDRRESRASPAPKENRERSGRLALRVYRASLDPPGRRVNKEPLARLALPDLKESKASPVPKVSRANLDPRGHKGLRET